MTGLEHFPAHKALIGSTDVGCQAPHIDCTSRGIITLMTFAGNGKPVQIYHGKVPDKQLQRSHLGVSRDEYAKIESQWGDDLAMCIPLLQPKEDLLEGYGLMGAFA